MHSLTALCAGYLHHHCLVVCVVCRARQPLSTNPADLVRVQQPDPVLQQQRQQGMDVMPLLQACLQAQQKPRTTVYLSGVWQATQHGWAARVWRLSCRRTARGSAVVQDVKER